MPEFDRFLFREAADVATIEIGPARIERRSVGRVEFPDGRVYACDPLVPMDTLPLALRLEPGSYEIVVFVAVSADSTSARSGNERNAAAAIICSDAAPVSWQLAAREGGPSDAAAYGVDAGTGAFMGTNAINPIVESGAIADRILEELQHRSSAVVDIPGGANVAVFTSGMGDGVYDTWIGRDVNERPCMILTDFDILDSADYVAAVRIRQAERAQKKWWEFWK